MLGVGAREQLGGIGEIFRRRQVIEVQVGGLGARRQEIGSGSLFYPGLCCQGLGRRDLETGSASQETVRLREAALIDRLARSRLGRDDLRIVGEQALPASLECEIFVRFCVQALPQLTGIVRENSLLAEPAQECLQDAERDALVCREAAEEPQGLVLLLVEPRHARCRLRRQVRQQPLTALRVGQDGAVGGFDEPAAEFPQAVIARSVREAVLGEPIGGGGEDVVGNLDGDGVPGIDILAQAGGK